jgi:hypothetical protein
MNLILSASKLTKSALVVTFFIGMAQVLVVPSTASAQVYTTFANSNAVANDLQNLLPKCTLGANPVLVGEPYTTTLSWTTQNATSVSISDVGTVAAVGQYTVSNVRGTRTFMLTAYNAYGPRTCSVTVYGQGGTTGITNTTYAGQNNTYYNGQYYTNQNTTNYPYQNYTPTQYPVQPLQNVHYGTPYGQAPQPVFNTNVLPRSVRSTQNVRLSRVPYTGPIEDAVAGMFSLTVLVSSLYGIRRLVA